MTSETWLTRFIVATCLAAIENKGKRPLYPQFVALGEGGLKAFGLPNAVLFDVKNILPLGAANGRL